MFELNLNFIIWFFPLLLTFLSPSQICESTPVFDIGYRICTYWGFVRRQENRLPSGHRIYNDFCSVPCMYHTPSCHLERCRGLYRALHFYYILIQIAPWHNLFYCLIWDSFYACAQIDHNYDIWFYQLYLPVAFALVAIDLFVLGLVLN